MCAVLPSSSQRECTHTIKQAFFGYAHFDIFDHSRDTEMAVGATRINMETSAFTNTAFLNVKKARFFSISQSYDVIIVLLNCTICITPLVEVITTARSLSHSRCRW